VKKPPTKEDTTHDADGAPGEPVLRECELLLSTRGEPELDPYRSILLVIEDDLRRRREVDPGWDISDDHVERERARWRERAARKGDDLLERVRYFEIARQGLSEHKLIRCEIDLVQEAIEAREVEDAAIWLLRARLALVDYRFADLTIEDVRGHLQRALDTVDRPVGGRVGAEAILAAMMGACGAHGVDDVKAAKKKIKNANRTESPKHGPFPSWFQVERLKEE
jgi:hypothetical protein